MPIHRVANTWCAVECEYGIFVQDHSGHIVSNDEAIRIASEIVRFAETGGMFAREYNRAIDIDLQAFEDDVRAAEIAESSTGVGSPKYVYLLECGGKYKIGISKDVARRIKELDCRPFPINLMARSKRMTHAQDLEQHLHMKMSRYNIDGEWFDLPDDKLSLVKSVIESSDDGTYLHQEKRL